MTNPQIVRVTSLAQFMAQMQTAGNNPAATPAGQQLLNAVLPQAPQIASKGTTMTTKTKSADSGVDAFYYRSELNIAPSLPDAKVAGFSNSFLKLKQSKIEDVRWDPNANGGAGDLVIIDERVTAIEQYHDPSDHQYGEYKVLKDGVKALAALAAQEGAALTGQVVVYNASTMRIFRLVVNGSKVEAQAASIGWPDGTQTPYSDNSNTGGPL